MKKQSKKKFKDGDRVAEKLEKSEVMQLIVFEDDFRKGTVVSQIPSPKNVLVKWDWPQDAFPMEVSISTLMSEDEANKQMDTLEKDFNKMTKAITTKMKVAGKAVREAHKLAEKLDLDDMSCLPVFEPLFAAMQECGWSTSSLSC